MKIVLSHMQVFIEMEKRWSKGKTQGKCIW